CRFFPVARPATTPARMLSSIALIMTLREQLTEEGAAITGNTPWVPAYAFSNTQRNLAGSGNNEAAATVENISLIGDVITEEELNACTTCRNCEDACPVMNEHVDKIIDLRRYLVMTEGKMD